MAMRTGQQEELNALEQLAAWAKWIDETEQQRRTEHIRVPRHMREFWCVKNKVDADGYLLSTLSADTRADG